MIEWDQNKDLLIYGKELTSSKDPQSRFLGESIREALSSPNFIRYIIKRVGETDRFVEIAKLATFGGEDQLNAYQFNPRYTDVTSILNRDDQGHRLDQIIDSVIGNFEIDQEMAEESKDLIKRLGLQTISGIFIYGNSQGKEGERIEIIVPRMLIARWGERKAIKISASFLRLSPKSEKMRMVHEEILGEKDSGPIIGIKLSDLEPFLP